MEQIRFGSTLEFCPALEGEELEVSGEFTAPVVCGCPIPSVTSQLADLVRCAIRSLVLINSEKFCLDRYKAASFRTHSRTISVNSSREESSVGFLARIRCCY